MSFASQLFLHHGLRLSANEFHLPLDIIFKWSSISNEDCIHKEIIFQLRVLSISRLSSNGSHIPSEFVYHCRSTSIVQLRLFYGRHICVSVNLSICVSLVSHAWGIGIYILSTGTLIKRTLICLVNWQCYTGETDDIKECGKLTKCNSN